METPDADLNIAKAFMNGVNDILDEILFTSERTHQDHEGESGT